MDRLVQSNQSEELIKPHHIYHVEMPPGIFLPLKGSIFNYKAVRLWLMAMPFSSYENYERSDLNDKIYPLIP